MIKLKRINKEYLALAGSHLKDCLTQLAAEANGMEIGATLSMEFNGSIYKITREANCD